MMYDTFKDQYEALFGSIPLSDVKEDAWRNTALLIHESWAGLFFQRLRERVSRSVAAKPKPYVCLDVIEAIKRDSGGKSMNYFSPEYLATEKEMKTPLFAADGRRLRAPLQCELPLASRVEINRIMSASARGEITSEASEGLFTDLFNVALTDYTADEQSNIRRNRGRPVFGMPEPHKDRVEDLTRARLAAAFGVEE